MFDRSYIQSLHDSDRYKTQKTQTSLGVFANTSSELGRVQKDQRSKQQHRTSCGTSQSSDEQKAPVTDHKPYKLIWKKTHERHGEHVHHEQYSTIEHAETRIGQLINTCQVSASDVKLYCNDMQLWNPVLHQQ